MVNPLPILWFDEMFETVWKGQLDSDPAQGDSCIGKDDLGRELIHALSTCHGEELPVRSSTGPFALLNNRTSREQWRKEHPDSQSLDCERVHSKN